MFRQAVTRSAQAARAPPLSARPRFFGAQQTEQTAYMFGRKPGAAKEGWEDIVYPCYAASAFVLIFGLAARPEADIKDWAREEALARLAVKEKGGEVEWGVHYGGSAKFNYEKDGVGAIPNKVE